MLIIKKGPESCSSAPATLLQDKAQPVPPSYRHTSASSTGEHEVEAPTARENLQAKKKPQRTFLGGEKSNAGRTEASAERAEARSRHAARRPRGKAQTRGNQGDFAKQMPPSSAHSASSGPRSRVRAAQDPCSVLRPCAHCSALGEDSGIAKAKQ